MDCISKQTIYSSKLTLGFFFFLETINFIYTLRQYFNENIHTIYSSLKAELVEG